VAFVARLTIAALRFSASVEGPEGVGMWCPIA
jgi:hypothetical protein